MEVGMPDLVLFASNNRGKFMEVSAVCRRFGVEALFPQDFARVGHPPRGIAAPADAAPVVEECAEDYAGNARLKADAFWAWSGLPALADDTGLEVRALQGQPGVHSARYAGPQARAQDNIDKLLQTLADLERRQTGVDRRAHFVCVLVLALEVGRYLQARAELNGEITRQSCGAGGFGYDSVFVPEGQAVTLAALKEARSAFKTHRILALESLLLSAGADELA